MNKSMFRMRLAVVAGAISSLTLFSGYAAETSPGPLEAAPAQPVVATQVQSVVPGVTVTASVTATAPVRLPYGVEDVLKLSRAQIGDDITLNYIQNNGTIYNL